MFGTKLRRALASVVLVSAVLLLPVGTAGAAPREGIEREGGRSFRGIVAHWEHLAWSFLASLLEKDRSSLNPDGLHQSSDDGH
ncbi:MAG TPA: hypothetical protein VGX68_04325 [Thermoanaerobaculia bacterium]|jgi:hypothetical protein|nr:hypothetical protein [Thermoanaerobaculia bacterium]